MYTMTILPIGRTAGVLTVTGKRKKQYKQVFRAKTIKKDFILLEITKIKTTFADI